MTLRAVVLDIEGTITPIAFVRDVLFPFARAQLGTYLQSHGDDPAVAAELAQINGLAPGTDPLAALLGWMDQDAKIPPLKTLQGLIWRQGYQSGALLGQIYPDVPPALKAWHAAGIKLYVYSSGSVEAQKLLLAHSDQGNLLPLFSGHFDTHTGPKREAESYRRIAAAIGEEAGECLFLSDIAAELSAAKGAGWNVCQLVREQDGTVADERYAGCGSFAEIEVG